MEETSQLHTDSEKDFVELVLEMTIKDDDELKRFVDSHLFPKKSQLSIELIQENIRSLTEMNENEQALIKARARDFEESNDPSKSFPSLLIIFGFIISGYALLTELAQYLGVQTLEILVLLLSIIVISIIGISTLRKLRRILDLRSTAIYFNTLINNLPKEEQATVQDDRHHN